MRLRLKSKILLAVMLLTPALNFGEMLVKVRAAGDPPSKVAKNARPIDLALVDMANKGNVNGVLALLSEGADANAFDAGALHLAAFFGYTEVVRALLSFEGLDVNSVDCYGYTALQMARRRGKTEVVHLIEQYIRDSVKSGTFCLPPALAAASSADTSVASTAGGPSEQAASTISIRPKEQAFRLSDLVNMDSDAARKELEAFEATAIQSLKRLRAENSSDVIDETESQADPELVSAPSEKKLRGESDPVNTENHGDGGEPCAAAAAVAEQPPEKQQPNVQFTAIACEKRLSVEEQLRLNDQLFDLLKKVNKGDRDFKEIQSLIAEGANPIVGTLFAREVLTKVFYRAVASGDTVVAKVLLGLADTSAKNESGMTALHVAIQKRNLSMVKILLADKRVEHFVNEIDVNGRTALHYAAASGNLATVRVLLDLPGVVRLNVDSVDKYGNTALHEAARIGNLAMVKALLARGANQHMCNLFARTPLDVARIRGYGRIVDAFLIDRANIKFVDRNGMGALHRAAASGNFDAVKALLAHKVADVNARDSHGATPIHYAAACGNEALINELVKSGAQVGLIDNRGMTALYKAAANGHEAVVKLLIDRGANVNTVGEQGLTALHVAARNGREKVVKLLLEHGANVNVAGEQGVTALHIAVSVGCETLAKLLLDHGANVNATVQRDWTALHVAAARGYESIVKLLLEHGADINAAGKDGETALDTAKRCKKSAVIALLEKNMHSEK